MIESVVICRHGRLGYTASLRFSSKSLDRDISATNKRSLYKTIDFIIKEATKVHEQ